MSPERQPVTDPEELQELKANILDQWRRLPPEAAAALMVEQLKDLMERGLLARPETDPHYQPFEVVSVCRADLEGRFSEEEIALFDDEAMRQLTDGMGDAYTDFGFWTDLELVGQAILEGKKKSGAGGI